MISTQYINLNMIPSGVMPVLYCSQYDIGRPLGMVVYNGGEAVNLDTYTCTIEATRTDGTAITAAVTTSNNIGVFVTTATMTNHADRYPVKLVLFDSQSHRVASLAFIMVVTPKTMDENAEFIEEDASLYQQYTETVQSLIADIREDIADINTHISDMYFNTCLEMRASTTLKSGMICQTAGYYAANDGGGALYRIYNAAPATHYETLANGLYAQLIYTDFVTVEMFGAYGDGTHDDTSAIENAVAYGAKKVIFAQKTYLTSGGIDVTQEIIIISNSATLKATSTAYETNEYVIALKSPRVQITGRLNIKCEYKINIGMLIASSLQIIDTLSVENACVWGLYFDYSTTAGSSIIKFYNCYMCGFRLHAKAKYSTNRILTLSNITGYGNTFNGLPASRKKAIIEAPYRQNQYVFDDSDYNVLKGWPKRTVFRSNKMTGAIAINSDGTSGSFTMDTMGGYIYPAADYVDGNNGRDVYIPVGGAACICNNFNVFQRLYSQLSPVVLMHLNSVYGTHIGYFGSHINDIPIIVNGINYGLQIDNVYCEGIGAEFKIQESNTSKIIAVVNDQNTNINVSTAFSTGMEHGFADNQIIVDDQQAATRRLRLKNSLISADYYVRNKLYAPNATTIIPADKMEVNEVSCRNWTVYAPNGMTSTTALIELNLINPEATNSGSGFEPFHLFVYNNNTGANVKDAKITISSKLKSLGYNINGAVNDILSVDTSLYSYKVEIVIILFNKTFYVQAKAIDFVTNT